MEGKEELEGFSKSAFPFSVRFRGLFYFVTQRDYSVKSLVGFMFLFCLFFCTLSDLNLSWHKHEKNIHYIAFLQIIFHFLTPLEAFV